MHPAYTLTQPAADVFFVQGPASNWMVLRRGAQFTLIDGGYRGDLPLVLRSIRDVGLEPDRAEALLLTHAHVDHTGAAAYFARTYGTPVLCSAAEQKHLQGLEKFQVAPVQVLVRSWRPRVFRWMTHVLRSGGATGIPVPSAQVWDDRLLAALPGRPVAVPTPGHTPGHTAFYLPDARAVVTGDALVTGHGISARTGPQLLHPMFHHDGARTETALAVLARLDADLLLPGHGPALRTAVRDAVAAARRQHSVTRRPLTVPLPGGRTPGWAGEPTYGRMSVGD